MSSLRVIIVKTTAFVAGLLCMLALMDTQLLRNAPTLESLKYRELLHPDVPADIVIFGSSIAVHGIRPETLLPRDCTPGRMYNFALYGAQPIFYRAWYDGLFRSSPHRPRAVILAVDWLSLDPDWKRVEQDSRYLPFRVFFNLWRSAPWSDRSMMLLNRSGVLRAGLDIVHVFLKSDAITRRYEDGYIALDGQQTGSPDPGRAVRMDGQSLAALTALITDVQQDGVALVLVHMPAMAPHTIADLPRLRQIYRRLAEHHGVPFVDFTDSERSTAFADPRLFSDGLHLNATGSNLLTNMLRAQLVTAVRGMPGMICSAE